MSDDSFKAARVRLNEQAALMLNIRQLLAAVPTGDSANRTSQRYSNFCYYRNSSATGGHISITKELYRNENINYLLRYLPPHILSGLVPSIKLYKVFIKKEENASTKFNSHSWRVPFDDIPFQFKNETSDFVATSLEDLVAGKGRMNNIGIKSFKYKYVGTNPAEVNTNIEAELEIFFQSVKDLVKEIKIPTNDLNYQPSATSPTEERNFAYVDLAVDSALKITDPKTPNKLVYNPNYYRIKAIIGYAEPSDNFLEDLIPDAAERAKVKDAIETAKIILYLNPYNHDITFEEDGRVSLKIKYIAAMTAALASVDAFSANPGPYQDLKRITGEYEAAATLSKEEIENIKKGCGDAASWDEKTRNKKIEEKEKESKAQLLDLRNKLENEKWRIYSILFQQIVGVQAAQAVPAQGLQRFDGRVYEAEIQKTDFGEPLSGPSTTDNPTQIRLLNIGGGIGGYSKINLTFPDTQNLGLSWDYKVVPTPTTFFGFSSTIDADSDETALKVNIERLERTVRTEFGASTSDPNSYKVKFVFLGDVINYFARSIAISIPDFLERPRLVLGDFIIEIPRKKPPASSGTTLTTFDTDTAYDLFSLSIPDIPISLNMLQSFFLEKIVRPARESYPLASLINDMILYMVIPAIAPSAFGRKAVLNKALRLSTLNISLPFNNIANPTDVLTGDSASSLFGGQILNPASLAALKTHFKIKTSTNTNQIGNYLFVYCSNQLPREIVANNGNITKDEKLGVYHFFIGTDTGIIKKVTFSRTDTPFYKEAKAFGSTGASNLGRLREVYDCNITMFGNNIYRPGDYIYIEPLFFTGTTALTLQNRLGLGGYYQVIDVETTISGDVYETVLNTVLAGYISEENTVVSIESRGPC